MNRRQFLTTLAAERRQPKADSEYEDRVIPPPNSVTVEAAGRVVLYDANGHALARQIGFRRNG